MPVFASITSMIVGALVATVTIFGLANGQVNSTSSTTVDANQPGIDYGSTR
jgi:hypothetical protein